MLQWSAKTTAGNFNSEKNDYSQIPQDKLISFNVYGFGYVLHVDVSTGALAVNGHRAGMVDLIDAINSEREWPVALHYFQRRFVDYSPTNGQAQGSGIEYVVVGWKGRRNMCYWRLDAEQGTVQLHVEEAK